MTTVDEVYQIVLYACSKNASQGYISPEDFNLVIKQAEKSYLDYLLGEYQKYMPTRPFAPVSFAVSQRIRTSAAPLIYGTVLGIDGTGFSAYPSDFENVDAMWGVYGIYRIRFTQQDSLFSKIHSVIDPIAANPVYTMENEGFRFYPNSLGSARMSYVRTPPYMVYRYTLDANGLPVYDPANSGQPCWSDPDILQIIVRALAIVGVNLQFGVVMEYSNIIKNGGQ